MLKRVRQNWFKAYFFVSLLMVIFFYGVVVGRYGLFPFKIFWNAKLAVEDWFIEGNYEQYLGFKPKKFLHPSRREGSGVVVYKRDKAYDGLTFLTGMWENKNGMILIDMDGTVLHRWYVSLNEIWPESVNPKWEKQLDDWDNEIHAAILYPNGDVVFNFAYEGLVKIDKCSKVIWRVPFVTHHSIYEDAGGNLWVPGRRFIAGYDKRFPLLDPPIEEDFVLKISPEGKILERISLLEVFYNSGQESLLFADGWNRPRRIGGDIFHTNDIEILEKSMADKFPLFKPGDIMVSLRNLNMIIVIDPDTKKIKWSMTGPFIRQHDPDFTADGHIEIFDNRADWAGGTVLGGSRVLSVDPVARTADTIYKGSDNDVFFSNIRGQLQRLPNGNLLISEYDAGRTFEITPSGEKVWSYINRYDEDEVYIVVDARRVPRSYGKFIEEVDKCR